MGVNTKSIGKRSKSPNTCLNFSVSSSYFINSDTISEINPIYLLELASIHTSSWVRFGIDNSNDLTFICLANVKHCVKTYKSYTSIIYTE